MITESQVIWLYLIAMANGIVLGMILMSNKYNK